MNNELQHYGVIGMKWGRHKYRNKDRTLTDAGKKKQDYDKKIKNAKQEIIKANKQYYKDYDNYKSIPTKKNREKLEDSSNKLKYSKNELSDIKTDNKLSGEKSKRQIDFEKKYMDDGLTKEEASRAAYKRIKTEKILAATASVTVVAAATYLAYKHYDKNVDRIIKSGKTLQNISTDSNKGVKDAFYSSYGKMDNSKYRGLYGDQLSKGFFGPQSVYETKIGVKNDLKIASPKSSIAILKGMVSNDDSFANQLEEHFVNSSGRMASTKQNKVINDGLKALKGGKVDSKVNEALNLLLVDHSPSGQAVSEKYYETLKSKGYDAIKDINDSKYSGYKSNNPLIIFNGEAKTSVDSIRELGVSEINKSLKIGYADIITKDSVKQGSAYASGIIATTTIFDLVNSKKNNDVVKKYREKHPDSNKTYNEIIRDNT